MLNRTAAVLAFLSLSTVAMADTKCLTPQEVSTTVALLNIANKAPGPDVAGEVVFLRRKIATLVCGKEPAKKEEKKQ